MCGHAGAVGSLRPLRRLSATEGWSRAGGRPGEVAVPARNRAAGGPHRGVTDGPAGVAAPDAPGLRARLSAHSEGGAPARRGVRSDLPDRALRVGRAVRSDPAAEPRAAPRPPAADLSRVRHALRACLGRAALRRGDRCRAHRPGAAVRAVQRQPRGRFAGRVGCGRARVGSRRHRPGVRGVRGDAAAGGHRGERAQHRRGRVRRPFSAGARLAVVPVPGPAVAAVAAAVALARAERRVVLRQARRSPAPGRRPVRRTLPRVGLARRTCGILGPMTDALLVDRADAVVTLTLNRPDSMNSLDVDLKEALRDTLAALESDKSCRAIVLTGAGKAFCGGQDLREHAAMLAASPVADMDTVRVHYNPIAQRLASMPKPVVAAVNGTAAGAGAGLALLADFRIGGPRTMFLMAFANVGLAGDT